MSQNIYPDEAIELVKTENGLWRATGKAVRLHVVGETPADALRKAGDFLDEVEGIRALSNQEGRINRMGKKRAYIPFAKRGDLIAKWGRAGRGEPPSIVYRHGAGGADRTDARVLSDAFEGMKNCFGNTLAEELEGRGFDLTTLKFSISQKEGGKDG